MNAQTKKLILGLLGPLIAAASAWLVAAVAKYGVHLDPTGVTALATAGVLAAASFVLKLIHDVEKPGPAPAEPQPAPAVPVESTSSPSGWPPEPAPPAASTSSPPPQT